MKHLTSHHFKWIARLSVSISLLIVIVANVNFDAFLAALGRSDIEFLLLGFVAFAMQGPLEAMRLRLVFASYDLTLLSAGELYLRGIFFSNFLPGMVGIDIYQIHNMTRIRSGLTEPVTLILGLRLVGLIANVALGALLVVFAFEQTIAPILLAIENHETFRLSLPIIILGLFALLFLAASSLWILNRDGRLRIGAERFINGLVALRDTLAIERVLFVFLLSLLMVMTRGLSVFLLISALGGLIGLASSIALVTIVTLLSMLPISFAGLGVREASLSGLLVGLGIPLSVALAVAVLGRLFLWILSLAGGLLILRAPEKIVGNSH